MKSSFIIILVILSLFYSVIRAAMKKTQKVAATPSNDNDPSSDDVFSTSTSQPEYFSYESVSPSFSDSVSTANSMPQSVDDPAASSFDLRQAVIYQTILNNDYISEVRSIN